MNERQIIAVRWKDEDEVAGDPIGPMTVVREGDPTGPRPFDPDREPEPWVTLRHARKFAESVGLELEEV